MFDLSYNLKDVVTMQQNDPDIDTVRHWVKQSQRPPRRQLAGNPVAQVVVPPALKNYILLQLHGAPTAAHFLPERVWELARRFCYWPSMFKDIKMWCEQCTTCQTRHKPVPIHQAPMGGSLTTRPFERVAMDILELPITTKGNRYVLVVKDYFTKFVNLYALFYQSAQTVAHCLFEDYILIHGIPESLHSDQGRQFESEVVSTLCRLLKIKKTRTTAYHPASDGMVERFNRTLTDQLAKILFSCGGEWDNYIKQVAFAYNSSPHLSTKFSPYFLVHGREPRMPTDVLLATHTLDQNISTCHAAFVSTLLANLQDAFRSARMYSEVAHDRQKLYHDSGLRHQPYAVGAMVWLHNPVESRMKLAPHWKGPFKIAQIFDSGGEPGLTYRIVSPMDSDGQGQVVHYNRLRPYTLPVPTLSSDERLSVVPHFLPYSPYKESDMLGGLQHSKLQKNLSEALEGPDQCIPGVSRAGRRLKPPGCLKDFVLF
uniref:Gypsy retrotransposon integrase-like protein 1 n=1 Tax=Cyprinus carpio TaxID=7962 RepID=A0A8C2IA21_CYPCA